MSIFKGVFWLETAFAFFIIIFYHLEFSPYQLQVCTSNILEIKQQQQKKQASNSFLKMKNNQVTPFWK